MIPLSEYVPEDVTNFMVTVEANISTDEGEGTTIFWIVVCTPDWLSEKISRNGKGIFTSGYLIIHSYSAAEIRKRAEEILPHCRGKIGMKLTTSCKGTSYRNSNKRKSDESTKIMVTHEECSTTPLLSISSQFSQEEGADVDLDRDFGIESHKSPYELTGEKLPSFPLETSLTTNARKYSGTPLKNLSAEGIRLLLLQNFHLEVIVPAAICHLSRNVDAGGHFEPGALIRILFLNTPSGYWQKFPVQWQISKDLLSSSKVKIEASLENESDEEKRLILKDVLDNFAEAHRRIPEIDALLSNDFRNTLE